MEYKRIFKDGINLFSGKILTIVIGLINLMILTRVLTTEDMGKYSLCLMIVNLGIQLGLNWSDTSIVRHGREEFVKHKKINKSFWARSILYVPLMVLFLCGYLIFTKQIAGYIGIAQSLVILILFLFLLNGITNSLSYIYMSIAQINRSSYILPLQKLIYVGGLALFLLKVIPAKLGYVLIIINISFFLILLYSILTFDYKYILPVKVNKVYLKKIWSFSWPQLIGFIGLYVINYADLFVIKKYLGFSNVGIYSVAYNCFTTITSILLTVNTLFMPLIVEYKCKKRQDLITGYVRKIPLFAAAWIPIILIGLIFSKPIMILVFSSKYLGSVAPFRILLISTLFCVVSTFFLPLINAYDLIIPLQSINVIKSIINVIVDLILVPKIGIMGAAFGTMAAYFCELILTGLLIFFKKDLFKGGEKENDKKLFC